tara:strand:- start:82 stop:291 length:210 start_codon:yes stop_codon:yes gene_type:complete
MGVARAMLFGTLAIIPGMLLALAGHLLTGSPDDWSNLGWLSCYLPFFGCVGIGVYIGFRDDGATSIEEA